MLPQYTKIGFQKHQKLLETIRGLADEKDATPAQIALAWVMAKEDFIVKDYKEDFGYMMEGVRRGLLTWERVDESASRILAR